MSGRPWYAEGLRFQCARCGHCCRGKGTVRIGDDEIGVLARRLDLSGEEFRVLYTRELRGGVVALREKGNRDCTFFDPARGCTVYSDRPRQCRTWPFWRNVVHSRERWEEEAESCPGMNRGPVHGASLVRRVLREDGTSGELPER